MGREELEVLKGGIVKRKTKRRVGLFIDATGLDRATRRLDRKVDLARLVRGLTSGLKIEVARYYALIPYEDDARQFAFLDAVERAGVEVVTKRLPPKGVKRQVSMDVHIATDIISYGYGHFEPKLDAEGEKTEAGNKPNVPSSTILGASKPAAAPSPASPIITADGLPKRDTSRDIRRLAIVVCPSREITYAIFMSSKLGVESSLADFGLYGTSDGWKGVDRWIDLSTSETIWRD